LLCNIYSLVIYQRFRYSNSCEGCLAVSNTALEPALKALIGFNNVLLKVVAIVRDQP
jgi:hypothetical protein